MEIMVHVVEGKKVLSLVFGNSELDKIQWRLFTDTCGWNKTVANVVYEKRKHTMTVQEQTILQRVLGDIFVEMNTHDDL